MVELDRSAVAAVAAAAVVLLAGRALSERLTLSTTYPAPVAVYRSVMTSGAGGRPTILNRDAGDTLFFGRVGIGVDPPRRGLDVQGTFRASGPAAAGSASVAGVAAAADVRIGALSAITQVNCGPGLTCSKTGNRLTMRMP